MPATLQRPATRGVEWEFERLTIARDFSRHVVSRMLVAHGAVARSLGEAGHSVPGNDPKKPN